MKQKNISVFLPTRKGSQRVKNKNTKQFAHLKGGLLELKLSQLIQVSSIEEIILSSNDETSIEIGKYFSKKTSKIKIIKRPDHLAQSSTDLVELVKYVSSICNANHILWTHVTSPFFETEDYERAILSYFYALNQGFDSLMSAKKYKNYLWDKDTSDIINRVTPYKWPQTQDLKELFEIDSAIFIASRDIYIEQSDRIGKKPKLFIQEGLKSFDIDWEDEFNLAEMIYEKNKKQKNKSDSMGF